MSIISKERSAIHQLSPQEIAALAEYLHLDWRDAVETAHAILSRADGLDLVGWALRDHVEKARWRCHEAEVARRHELYQRFLDRRMSAGQAVA